ncbi:MAG: filamentous hemagglutinin N-terminal domain-containing protein [Candidatus Brocadiaceae bacterium]|nr:filamentous hemagglutinin N-terminal domain-containing protein [Candidatus Brocadiaceae bacterium]
MTFNHCYNNFLRLLTFISTFSIYCFMLNHCHAQITLDGSMGTSGPLAGPDFNITSDLGQFRGSNLFHSFGEFNIQAGERATFSGPGAIANILSRVTGGNQSFINGTLASTIPGANLYLLNPAGVLFGANARLNVSGSFHVSTADYLRFSDGTEFHADLSKGSILTVAPVAAFGFLGDNPASIKINNSILYVPDGETISAVGGDIEITGNGYFASAQIGAGSGQINIASVASDGEVVPNASGGDPDLNVDSFSSLGDIEISQGAYIDASGGGSGTVVVRGGCLMMDNSYIYASTSGPAAGLLAGEPGAGIDIEVTDDIVFDNGAIMETGVYGNVVGNLGGIQIQAEHLEVSNGAYLWSPVAPGSTGDSGDIEVNTDSVLIRDGGIIGSDTYSSGDTGDIIVNTKDLQVRDGGLVFTRAIAGSGNGGDIILGTEKMRLSNADLNGGPTIITTRTLQGSTGKAGDVKVSADNLQISGENNTSISSTTYGSGRGGNVDLIVNGDMSMSGSVHQPYSTQIIARTLGFGDGGNMKIAAHSLTMTEFAEIAHDTVYYSGNGGNFDLTTRSLVMTESAKINGGTFLGYGDAGDSTINTGSLELRNEALITTGSFWSVGNSGDLDITADSIFISGIDAPMHPTLSTGFSTATYGNVGGIGGNLHIKTNSLIMARDGIISGSTWGSGSGGDVKIDAGAIQVLDGSQIQANGFGSGNGGNIEVNADSVLVSGVNEIPFLNFNTGLTTLSVSAIASQATTNGANAGDVSLKVRSLELLDGGRISTETFGPGNAGTVEVVADSVRIAGVNDALKDFLIDTDSDTKFAGSSILATSRSNNLGAATTGNGGLVRIEAENVQIGDQGLISSETDSPGTGGNIEMIANNLSLYADASISALSKASGKSGNITMTVHNTFQSDHSSVTTSTNEAVGGDINITAGQNILLRSDTFVSAKSSGVGNAGNITINAGSMIKSESSSMTTESSKADGGNINLTSGYLTHLVSSEIASSVGGGPDTVGGNITMNQPYVVMDNSKIIAQANEGSGGNIQITADVFIADFNSIVSASSAKGVDGEVDIRATVKNISGNIGPLKEDYSSAHSLLLEPCAVRMSDGSQSSLVVAGRDGLPRRPGDLLPSPLYDSDMAKEDAEVAGILDIPPLAYGINFFEDKGLLPLDMFEKDTGCAICP